MMIGAAGDGIKAIDAIGADMVLLPQMGGAVRCLLIMPEHFQGSVRLVACVPLIEGAGAAGTGRVAGCGGGGHAAG